MVKFEGIQIPTRHIEEVAGLLVQRGERLSLICHKSAQHWEEDEKTRLPTFLDEETAAITRAYC